MGKVEHRITLTFSPREKEQTIEDPSMNGKGENGRMLLTQFQLFLPHFEKDDRGLVVDLRDIPILAIWGTYIIQREETQTGTINSVSAFINVLIPISPQKKGSKLQKYRYKGLSVEIYDKRDVIGIEDTIERALIFCGTLRTLFYYLWLENTDPTTRRLNKTTRNTLITIANNLSGFWDTATLKVISSKYELTKYEQILHKATFIFQLEEYDRTKYSHPPKFKLTVVFEHGKARAVLSPVSEETTVVEGVHSTQYI